MKAEASNRYANSTTSLSYASSLTHETPLLVSLEPRRDFQLKLGSCGAVGLTEDRNLSKLVGGSSVVAGVDCDRPVAKEESEIPERRFSSPD